MPGAAVFPAHPLLHRKLAVLAALQRRHGLVKIGVIHQRFGAGVLQDVGDFSRHQAPVDRHHHRADLGHGEVGFHKFDTVLEQRGDAVARANALVASRPLATRLARALSSAKVKRRSRSNSTNGFAIGADLRAFFQKQSNICFHVMYCRQVSDIRRVV